ncbi:MAG: excinuclease ABC subunit UvrC [Gammaproteobacteria bacterium]|nr:excinuclease ABC subunit UvrC [Gammaproteobacteria bacterium]
MSPAAPAFDGKAFVATLPRRPGVYRMHAADGELIYVGKASSLRDRVGSYFNPSKLSPKVQALVAQIAAIEVTVTNSDTEALLLEYNLIKEHKPRYNVVLRDDKSYPYIWLDTSHEYPRLSSYRGSRAQPGRYFGPFPGAGAVNETLHYLQKIFRLRNCRDSYFENRSRPCLQYQIGRCSGPCVRLIEPEAYARDVEAVTQVLEGGDTEVNAQLAARMEEAAQRLDFETAARLRDQLAALKQIQATQIVAAEGERDADVFAIAGDPGQYAVSVMLVRGGRSLGTSGYFPRGALAEPPEALASFLMQYYDGREPPPEVFVELVLEDAEALGEALSQLAGRSVRIKRAQRGMTAKWVEMVRENATQALRMRLARRDAYDDLAAALADELGLAAPPARMECFDISHTQGEGTVASCVVFGSEGPLKKDYRRFNITGIAPGDDYAALRQAVQRRYTRVRDGEIERPDLLLIDGGPAQLAGVREELVALGFADLPVIGVSKGADRRAGQERIHLPGEAAPRIPGPESAGLKLIQRIRDEAHRFAIAGHRRRRARRFSESILETVPGLGPAKRRALLRHFGGLQGVLKAGVADLERVEGIGATLARSLYDHLHPGE